MIIEEKLAAEKQRVQQQADAMNKQAAMKTAGIEAIVLPTNWRIYYKHTDGSVTTHVTKKM